MCTVHSLLCLEHQIHPQQLSPTESLAKHHAKHSNILKFKVHSFRPVCPQSANPAPAFGQRPTIFGLRHFGEPLLLLQAQTHIVHDIGGRHSPEVGPSHRELTGLRLSCAERQTKRPKKKLRERPRAKSPCKSQNS